MENFRKGFLKIHGALLLLLGGTFSTLTLAGRFYGTGPFKFLFANPQAAIGFFEAYLLVAVCGTFLLVGSFQSNVQKWNRMGALVHLPLAVTNLTFWPFYAQVDMQMMGIVSTTGHFIIIGLESFLGFSKK